VGYLIDLLVWVFPELSESLESWRRSSSPVYLILAAVLGALGVGLVILALNVFAAQ
jgi:hypothetical protein